MFNSSRKHSRFGVSPFGKRLEGYAFTDTFQGKAKYTYTGEYYSKKLSDKDALKRRIFNYAASFVMIILFFFAGYPRSAVNSSIFIGLASGITIMTFIWLIYILIVMMMNKNRLTIWAFRVTALQFFWCLVLLSFTGVLSVAYNIIYMTGINSQTLATDITGCILRIVQTGLVIAMLVIEYNTEYNAEYPDS